MEMICKLVLIQDFLQKCYLTLTQAPRAPRAPLAEAVRAIGEDAMTRVFAFRGDAMTPTLRGGARDAPGPSSARGGSGTEYVLARRLAHPFRSAAIGDVVAFAHPSDATRTLIRRVSATEGDELVDAANASVYVVPKDHAWVTADADAETDSAKSAGRHELRKEVALDPVLAVRAAVQPWHRVAGIAWKGSTW